jgi:hypothetical protein
MKATWATQHQDRVHSPRGQQADMTIQSSANKGHQGPATAPVQAQTLPLLNLDLAQAQDSSPEQVQNSSIIQQQLTPMKSNTPFGDLITTKQTVVYVCSSKMQKSIYKYQSWKTLVDATKQFHEKSIDVIENTMGHLQSKPSQKCFQRTI